MDSTEIYRALWTTGIQAGAKIFSWYYDPFGHNEFWGISDGEVISYRGFWTPGVYSEAALWSFDIRYSIIVKETQLGLGRHEADFYSLDVRMHYFNEFLVQYCSLDYVWTIQG